MDNLITATVVTSSVRPGGAPKHTLHPATKSALKLAKATLTNIILTLMLLMFIVLQWASLNNSTGFADLNLVLHPNYKLDYF
jgi:hypothetical protein